MECKYFKELISAYIDGYIDDKEKKQTEEHLLICKDCKKYFEELEKSLGVLRNLEKVEAPFGFEKKVIEKIKGRERSHIPFFNKKFLLEFSVTIFALASILFVYLNLTPKKAEEIPGKIVEKIRSKEDLGKKDITSSEIKTQKEEIIKREEMDKLKEGESMAVPKIVAQSADEGPPKELEKKFKNEILQEKMEVAEEKEIKLQQEISLTQEVENKKTVMVLGESPLADKIEKKIKIEVKAKDFENSILKIENILKNNDISYTKKIKREKGLTIIIKTKDLKIFLEKVSALEEIKIEEPNGEKYGGEEVVLEILKD